MAAEELLGSRGDSRSTYRCRSCGACFESRRKACPLCGYVEETARWRCERCFGLLTRLGARECPLCGSEAVAKL